MPPSIQVYEGTGAPRGIAVRKMLKKPLPKKPVYVLHREPERDGFEKLVINVRGTGEFSSMRDPYFTIRWQGGEGNLDRSRGSVAMERWYAGCVELTGKAKHDLKLHVRWLQKLINKVGTVDDDPMRIIEALESIGILEGAYDNVVDRYVPVDRLVPDGFHTWYEGGTSSSMSALSVIAENEDEAKALIEERLSSQSYYDNRLDAWRAAGRPVNTQGGHNRKRTTKADIPFKRVAEAT